CNENRLMLYKGFGKKTQDNVIESIEFYLSQQGNYLFAQVEILAAQLEQYLQKLFNLATVEITGHFRRHSETVDLLEYILPLPLNDISEGIKPLDEFTFLDEGVDYLSYQYNNGIKIKLHSVLPHQLAKKQFDITGSVEFITEFYAQFSLLKEKDFKNENEIFSSAGIPFIPPFLRENENIINVAAHAGIPQLIQPEDICAIIHCHSNWSDGSDALEKLATACKKSGKEYMVISDHSKTATYAQGLQENKIRAQHELIDELNEKLKPFKIFKSIESDILNDGSLDYSDPVLSTFDLVIASVHSNLKMNEEKAMNRLLNAIENPYTTILGHMTGRLLLSRRGFPVDHEKII